MQGDKKLSQPLCIVLGMGAGISFAVASRFARENFQIAMVGRSGASLNDFERKLQASGFSAKGFVGDANEENSLRRALAEIAETLGECEALIYNAYGLTEATASEVSIAGFRRDTEANYVRPAHSRASGFAGDEKTWEGNSAIHGRRRGT